jgi:mono/diheme cytochrome c family protein
MSEHRHQHLFWIFAATAGIAAAFFVGLVLGRRNDTGAAPHPLTATAATDRVRLPSGTNVTQTDGATTAFVYCLPCHRPDGHGIPGVFPPLAGSKRLIGEPRAVIALVLRGIDTQSDPHAPRWNGKMQGLPHLGDEDIAAALTYARNAWGNQASAITPAQVSEVRTRTAGQTAPLTPAELIQAFAPIQ